MPGTESKPALQLSAVGSYLQWLEAAAPTTGNNILKSFELHRTETPQLQLQWRWGLRRRVKIQKEQDETFLLQYLLNVWIQSKKIPKQVYNLTVFIRCLKGNFYWAILLLQTATGKKSAPCCISFILLFQLQLQSTELRVMQRKLLCRRAIGNQQSLITGANRMEDAEVIYSNFLPHADQTNPRLIRATWNIS